MKDSWPSCSYNTPIHFNEPPIVTPHPDCPFQKICRDYFESNGHHYLTIAIILRMVQLQVTTLLPNAEHFSWTWGFKMNSVQMVAYNSPWLPTQSFCKHGV